METETFLKAKSRSKDWFVFLVTYTVTWFFFTGLSLYLGRNSGRDTLPYIFFIFPFLFDLVATALVTFVLLEIFKSAKSRPFLPIILSILYIGYFFIYDNKKIIDLSTQSEIGAMITFSSPMISYIAIAGRGMIGTKKIAIFTISSFIGLAVALMFTFPTRATDKILYFNQPEMNKLDIRKIVTEGSIPASFGNPSLMIYYDRGIRQIANIETSGSGKANYYGAFQAAVRDGKNHIDSVAQIDPATFTNNGKFSVESEMVSYQCSVSLCRYDWNFSNIYYFRLDINDAKSLYYNGTKLTPQEMFDNTKGFAETLVKNSLYLK